MEQKTKWNIMKQNGTNWNKCIKWNKKFNNVDQVKQDGTNQDKIELNEIK